MELKEGMYVRCKCSGIGQVKEFCTCECCEKRGFYEPIIEFVNYSEYVTSYNNMQDYEGRASYNIIDLIEVGDYVNGYYIEDIEEVGYEYDNGFKANERVLRTNIIEFDNIYPIGRKGIRQNEIKSIVTKQQFSAMEYKID